jgi:hypothetical protein
VELIVKPSDTRTRRFVEYRVGGWSEISMINSVDNIFNAGYDEKSQKYAFCMANIQQRIEVINSIALEYTVSMPIVEFIALQLRKILESIALSTLVANVELYKEKRKSFYKDWNARGIMDDLSKINENFYPLPVETILATPSQNIGSLPIKEYGFLKKERYIEAYNFCSNILHTENPFSIKDRNHHNEMNTLFVYCKEAVELLSSHVAVFSDKDAILCILSSSKDNPIQICKLEKEIIS